MASPIDDTIAQKIYKVIEEQGKALKKIEGRLSQLEESKLKKTMHIEYMKKKKERNGMKETRPIMRETSNLRNLSWISWL